jgi:hypothetical protein
MELSALESLQIIAAFAQILVAIIALVVSAIITVLVNRGMKRSAQLQYWRAVGEAWMEINTFALSNDEHLRLADSLFHPDKTNEPTKDLRKRWFGYMALNTFVSAYSGVSTPPELRPGSDHRERVKLELKPLMEDDVLYELSQSGVYSSEFEKVCRDLRREQGFTD